MKQVSDFKLFSPNCSFIAPYLIFHRYNVQSLRQAVVLPTEMPPKADLFN